MKADRWEGGIIGSEWIGGRMEKRGYRKERLDKRKGKRKRREERKGKER